MFDLPPPQDDGLEIPTVGEWSRDKHHFLIMKGHPLYMLIFCSKHPVAAKIWRGTSQKKPDDQFTFDFGPPEPG
ncbi:MAG: hypothetical protein ACYTF1_27050 [Planctomycetota bacterium]|jgi:hypothetical protein